MGYKLADGSDSDLYQVGDDVLCVYGQVKVIQVVDGSEYALVSGLRRKSIMVFSWSELTPTEETKHKAENRKMYRDFDEKCKQLLSERKCFSEIMRDLYRLASVEIDEEKLDEIKRAISQESKCKCGYIIPVMEIGPARDVDFGEPWETPVEASPEPALIDSLRALKDGIINNSEAKALVQEAIDALSVEPLARIIDWRGGEKVEIFDLVIGNFENYSRRALIVSHDNSDVSKLESCRGAIDLHQCDAIVIRINTESFQRKRRIMTLAEVEREFGVKVVD